MKVPKEVMTHSGRFHADDVFSTALLRIINPNIVVQRVNKLPLDFKGLVYDLNGGEFDHHGNNDLVRENGVAYASFGLLWKTIGKELVGEVAALLFDETFVQPLDIQDNQGGNNQLARAITQANPNWDSRESSDSCFFKAVDFAEFILRNEIESMHSVERAKSLVKEALKRQKNGIVILEVGVPWKSVLVPEDVYFVVYPATRGGYNAQAVPIKVDSQVCKVPFPEEWRGRTTEEIEVLTGIADIKFCHLGGYLVGADTKEGAIRVCCMALEMQKN